MINDEAYEVIKKLFDSLKNWYQNNSELMKVVSLSLIVDLLYYLLYYKCHKINWNCGGSYVDTPD